MEKKRYTPVKRALSYDVHELEISDNVTINGKVIELLEVKNKDKCKYFSGKLSDGINSARFVSFELNLRPSIEKLHHDKSPIALSGCRVQQNIKTNPVITIDELQTTSVNQHVSVIGKIIRIEAPVEVNTKAGKKLQKQDCFIRDSDSTCRIVLWESNVGILEKNKSYKLVKFLVWPYDGVKYLSLCDSSTFEAISGIEEISDDDDTQYFEEPQPAVSVVCGEIIAVLSTTDYVSCVSCTGTVHSINGILGQFTHCNATIKLKSCNSSKSARIVVASGTKKWHHTAYNEELEVIIKDEQGESLEEKLLNIDTITIHYNTKNNVIKQVEKHQ
uniref:Replication protein A OB domain-containing protein n=1 Tax=Amphimedon queenslandica TaxID=400682 RepID=A0A1X7VMY7_AMPQE